MIDWRISILVALLAVWLAHRLTLSRQTHESYRKKAKEFKELLVPFLKTLESEDAHPALLVSQHFPEHDQAARRLELYMSRRMQHNFFKHWRRYADLYAEKKAQGILTQFATEVDDLEKASSGTPEAKRYIYQQTARRRNELRIIIQKALDVL